MAHHQFPLAAVPDGVLAECALVALPPRKLGLAAMACLKLRRCADEVILRRAGSVNLERRDGETMGSLLFALHVLRITTTPTTGVSLCTVSCGEEHTAVSTSTGELFTFGCGEMGRLGHDNHDNEWVPRRVEALTRKCVVQVACGDFHTAAVTSEGELFAFGGSGRLGHGVRDNELVPRRVEALVGKRVVQVACGSLHTAVVTSEGELYTFGKGSVGRLGHRRDWCWEWVPRRVEALAGKCVVVQVSCGDAHTAVVTSTGELFTFGHGREGQLGHNSNDHESVPKRVGALVGKCIVQVSCGFDHTAVITSEGELCTFGQGREGQLGHGEYNMGRIGVVRELVPRRVEALVGRCIVQVSCNGRHTAAVTSDGELWTFGYGSSGQLGNGGEDNELVPQRVEALVGKRVVRVAYGMFHAAVLTSEGELYTFGYGDVGQLGHGGEESARVPRRVEALGSFAHH